jgi:uncharacterized protein YyaL (SSP411 family)
MSFRESASALNTTEEELEIRMEGLRRKVLSVREKRVHPYKDDKVLTDWNGLMIASLARGARVLDEPEYAKAGGRTAEFILQTMRKPDGSLLHSFRDGRAAVQGNADDYAFLIWGLIELYEAGFRVPYLRKAVQLNQDLLSRFWDAGAGGLFFTPHDGEELIARKKVIYDGALPSANAVAMWNLMRLARLTGDSSLEEKAWELGRAFSRELEKVPSAHTQFMVALDFSIGPSHEVIIAGDERSIDTREMLRALERPYLPNKVVILRPTGGGPAEIEEVAGFVRHQEAVEGRATAYVCSNFVCASPTTDAEKMLELLTRRTEPR